jgi:peptide/nickel transport system permease protein
LKLLPLAVVVSILLGLAAVAALAPVKCKPSYPPLQPPSRSHPLGTDPVGRDALCIAFKGSLASIEAGLSALATAVAVLAASTFAAVSSHVSRTVDSLAALVAGLPKMSLLLLLALITKLPPWGVGLLIGLLASMRGVRSVANRAKQAASMPYVEAAKAIGAPKARIVLRHILPSTWASTASYASIAAATAVYAEAGLSMLGLGDPTRPSWGLMINLILTTPGAILTPSGLLQVMIALLLIALTAAIIHLGVEHSRGSFQ